METKNAEGPTPGARGPENKTAALVVNNRSPPLVVMAVLVDYFLPYRGLRLSEEGPPSRDTIIRDLDSLGYARLTALRNKPRGARDAVIFLVLAAESKQAHHSGDLRKLLEGLRYDPLVKEGRLDEVLLIVDDAFLSKKNVLDVVRAFQKDGPDGEDPEGARGAFYTVRPYCNFMCNIPAAQIVPKHQILTPSQVKERLSWHSLKIGSLPLIRDSDPPVVWLGARPGQVVLITRDSETSVVAEIMRRVVKAALAEPKSSSRGGRSSGADGDE
jgi:DNA-directed RNA polymerase subunit H